MQPLHRSITKNFGVDTIWIPSLTRFTFFFCQEYCFLFFPFTILQKMCAVRLLHVTQVRGHHDILKPVRGGSRISLLVFLQFSSLVFLVCKWQSFLIHITIKMLNGHRSRIVDSAEFLVENSSFIHAYMNNAHVRLYTIANPSNQGI